LLFALSACALAALLLVGGLWRGHLKMNRILQPTLHPVALVEDAQALERGRYLYASRGCAECHGADGAGKVFIDDPAGGLRAISPNISPGPGNVVAAYSATDWDRTLRHGVKRDGRPLLIMPSEDYAQLSNEDLAALVMFVRHLPPAKGGEGTLDLPLMFPVLYGLGLVKDAAEKIDHERAPVQAVAAGVTPAYGEYVAQMCQGCHGSGLSGGAIPGAPPAWPVAANLTPGEGSAMGVYAELPAFKAMLRSGRRPDGSAISRVMPFASLGALSDIEAGALHLYLRGLPRRAAGQH